MLKFSSLFASSVEQARQRHLAEEEIGENGGFHMVLNQNETMVLLSQYQDYGNRIVVVTNCEGI